MKRITLIIYVISLSMALVSCSTEYPHHEEAKDAFCFNEIKYNTLQNAIDAAVALKDDDSTSEHYIKLLTNTSGPGAVVPDDFYESIHFDLGGYNYEITDGGSIEINNATFFLSGEGGYLFDPAGHKPLLNSKEGAIYINDDFALSSEGEAIRTHSYILVDKDFTGSITGDITIIQDEDVNNFNNFEYMSTKGSMDIGKLTLTGKDATFDVRKKLDKDGSISVMELKADRKNALRAIDNTSVKLSKGGEVHVHSWKMAEHQEKSCISDEYIKWECSACGDSYFETVENSEEAKCPVDSLVHHAAVEATDFERGNIEYWECPFCGSLYADSKALTKLEKNPVLEPEYEKDSDQWTVEYCFESQTKNPAAVFDAVSRISTVVGTIYSGGSFVESVISDAEKLKKLDNILTGIETLKKELGNVEANLLANMEKLACQKLLYDRYQTVNKMEENAKRFWIPLVDTLKNDKISQEAKLKAATDIVTSWHKEAPDFYSTLVSCLQNFYGGENLFESVPIQAERFQNNKQRWEHNGYGWRTNFNAIDISKMIICCQMELVYQELVTMPAQKSVAEISIKTIKDSFAKYYQEYQRDSAKMATRNAKYRVFVSGSKNQPFVRGAKTVDIRGWFKSNRDKKLPWIGHGDEYKSTIDKLMQDLDMNDIMDQEDAKNICGASTKCYKEMGDVGFNNFAGAYDQNLLLLGRDNCKWYGRFGFTAEYKSRYKCFFWSYKDFSSGKDVVQVETILRDNTSYKQEDLNIMKNANIRINWHKGTINDMGTYSEKRPVKIIKKVKAEEKAEALK